MYPICLLSVVYWMILPYTMLCNYKNLTYYCTTDTHMVWCLTYHDTRMVSPDFKYRRRHICFATTCCFLRDNYGYSLDSSSQMASPGDLGCIPLALKAPGVDDRREAHNKRCSYGTDGITSCFMDKTAIWQQKHRQLQVPILLI